MSSFTDRLRRFVRWFFNSSPTAIDFEPLVPEPAKTTTAVAPEPKSPPPTRVRTARASRHASAESAASRRRGEPMRSIRPTCRDDRRVDA